MGIHTKAYTNAFGMRAIWVTISMHMFQHCKVCKQLRLYSAHKAITSISSHCCYFVVATLVSHLQTGNPTKVCIAPGAPSCKTTHNCTVANRRLPHCFASAMCLPKHVCICAYSLSSEFHSTSGTKSASVFTSDKGAKPGSAIE